MQVRDKAEPSAWTVPEKPDNSTTAAGASARVVRMLQAAGLEIATAESCTAGLLSTLLAAAPGASRVLRAGFVVYSKAAKTDVLGVPSAALNGPSGAVTPEVARIMARRARLGSGADIGVSITGVVGPSCDEDGNPVGRIEIACDRERGQLARSLALAPGPREDLSAQAALAALELVAEAMTLLPAGRQP